MKLFGGAITADIPATLLDASDMREVPDNQEVYVGSFQAFDVSLIIELLEPVDKSDLTEALCYHVEETHRISDTEDADREEPLEILKMELGKYEYVERIDIVNTKEGYVSLVFGLFRLPRYHTEVLVTCTLNPQKHKPGAEEVDVQKQVVMDLVKSFDLLDPSLFGEEVDELEKHHAKIPQ